MSDMDLYLALVLVSDDDWQLVQDAFWRRDVDRVLLVDMAARYGIEVD